MHVSVFLSNCKQSITSLSLLAGRAVVKRVDISDGPSDNTYHTELLYSYHLLNDSQLIFTLLRVVLLKSSVIFTDI